MRRQFLAAMVSILLVMPIAFSEEYYGGRQDSGSSGSADDYRQDYRGAPNQDYPEQEPSYGKESEKRQFANPDERESRRGSSVSVSARSLSAGQYGPAPRDDFDPKEMIVGMLFERATKKAPGKFNPEDYVPLCPDAEAMVDKAIANMKELGLLSTQEFCSEINSRAKECREKSTAGCERMKQGDFGPPGFKLSCPPSKEAVVSFCIEKSKEHMERAKAQMGRMKERQKRQCDRQFDQMQRECQRQQEQQKRNEEQRQRHDEQRRQYDQNRQYQQPNYDGQQQQNNYQQPTGDQQYQQPSGETQTATTATGSEPSGSTSTDGSATGGTSGTDSGTGSTGGTTGGTSGTTSSGSTSTDSTGGTSGSGGTSDSSSTSSGGSTTPTGQAVGYGDGNYRQEYREESGRGWGTPDGGGFDDEGGDEGPRFSCDQSRDQFVDQCFAQMEANVPDMEQEARQRCEEESQYMIEDFEDMCSELDERYGECIEHSQQACSFAEKTADACSSISEADIRAEMIKQAGFMCKTAKYSEDDYKEKEFRHLKGAPQAGKVIPGLQKARENAPDEFKAIIDRETDDFIEVSDELEALEEKEDSKGIGYKLKKFLGLAAEEERKDAEAIKKSSEKLGETIANLEKVADQLEDATARKAILEQAESLKERQEALEELAAKKENRASGLLSFLTGEFLRK